MNAHFFHNPDVLKVFLCHLVFWKNKFGCLYLAKFCFNKPFSLFLHNGHPFLLQSWCFKSLSFVTWCSGKRRESFCTYKSSVLTNSSAYFFSKNDHFLSDPKFLKFLYVTWYSGKIIESVSFHKNLFEQTFQLISLIDIYFLKDLTDVLKVFGCSLVFWQKISKNISLHKTYFCNWQW